jgi:hypothetical protein
MGQQRHETPDDGLPAWQEWMSHPPGYTRMSGRIPPTSRYGRRPTKAGYVLVVLGVLSLLTPVPRSDAPNLWALAGMPTVGGVLVSMLGWRLAHPYRSGKRQRGR